jgi:hypothetical protein
MVITLLAGQAFQITKRRSKNSSVTQLSRRQNRFSKEIKHEDIINDFDRY